MIRSRIALIAAIAVGAFSVPISLAQPPDVCLGQLVNDNRTTDDADFLTGTEGIDVAATGTGPDQYFAAGGADILCGGPGNDVLVGEEGADDLSGEGNADLLVGMSGPDVLRGGEGEDNLQGAGGNDELRPGPGDGEPDQIFDGPGSDLILGGSEDTWHKCEDGEPDDHDSFGGDTVTDPDC